MAFESLFNFCLFDTYRDSVRDCWGGFKTITRTVTKFVSRTCELSHARAPYVNTRTRTLCRIQGGSPRGQTLL